jgi:hypothetical protein
MLESNDAPTITIKVTQSKLRAMFVAGFGLNAVSFFFPSYHAPGVVDRMFSSLEIIRSQFANGRDGWGLFNVLAFCSIVGFAVLGMKYPRRWVFLSGACVTCFLLVMEIFTGSGRLEQLFLPRLLDYVATGMQILGFWIHPVAAERSAAQPLSIFR